MGRYGMEPAPGKPAEIDLSGRMDEAKRELASMKRPEQAQKAEAEARAMKEIAAAKSTAEAHAHTLHAAEVVARSMRRFGELLPKPSPGKKTAEPLQRAEEDLPELSAGAISNRRRIAAIPEVDFEAELAKHRDTKKEITQSALLKLAPREPKGGGSGRKVSADVRLAKRLVRLAEWARAIKADETAIVDLEQIARTLRGERPMAGRDPITGGTGESY